MLVDKPKDEKKSRRCPIMIQRAVNTLSPSKQLIVWSDVMSRGFRNISKLVFTENFHKKLFGFEYVPITFSTTSEHSIKLQKPKFEIFQWIASHSYLHDQDLDYSKAQWLFAVLNSPLQIQTV